MKGGGPQTSPSSSGRARGISWRRGTIIRHIKVIRPGATTSITRSTWCTMTVWREMVEEGEGE